MVTKWKWLIVDCFFYICVNRNNGMFKKNILSTTQSSLITTYSVIESLSDLPIALDGSLYSWASTQRWILAFASPFFLFGALLRCHEKAFWPNWMTKCSNGKLLFFKIVPSSFNASFNALLNPQWRQIDFLPGDREGLPSPCSHLFFSGIPIMVNEENCAWASLSPPDSRISSAIA